MKAIMNIFVILGIAAVLVFAYQLFDQARTEQQSLVQAEAYLSKTKEDFMAMKKSKAENIANFAAEHHEPFAILEIPKLEKSLPIVEGVEADDLKKGIGHISNTAYPGQGEQIVISGHRDTVFRGIGALEIGDHFVVDMPYDTYTYEIRETEIVPEDDTTVIRSMGEEVLVVTTCYPFNYVGNAPYRFIYYAYPL
ncbi:class D sortase [Paenibacillus sp. GXUN7292]|uniref:class D sortase n=1 Tax=Paenibacillus sp. GXUN7292 TaxID=3422499 RepID=UPI003D7E079F